LTWAVVAAISSPYFFGLTPGHVFGQDDFAAYVMHATNLVEGRPYSTIRYVHNPQAPWVSPVNGYPPVYPLLLAPVYRLRELDLHAMKVLTVFTFVMFLVAFAAWSKPVLSPHMRTVAVALVGFEPSLLELSWPDRFGVSLHDVFVSRTVGDSARLCGPQA